MIDSDEIYTLTQDGLELGRLLQLRDSGENVNGLHQLPSGQFAVFGGGKIFFTRNKEEAEVWYFTKLAAGKA